MGINRVDDYTFVNYPERRTRDDYDNAINKIVELHKYAEEVIAIYCFGSISAPGISDIDYFIVTKGEDTSFRYKCHHNKLTEKEKYLFQHYPSAIVPKRLLPKVHLLAPFFEIERIYQKKGYAIDPLSIEISKDHAQIFLADAIFMVYPKIFICTLEKKRVDVRAALTIMHALRYPSILFGKIGIRRRKWELYNRRVDFFREHWFEKSKQEIELIALLKEAILIAMDMIEAYSNCYNKKEECNDKQMVWRSRTISVIFEDEYNKENELSKMLSIYAKNKLFTSVLPEAIKQHLVQYACQNNLFGGYVKKYLGIKDAESNCSEIVKERTEAMSTLLMYTTKIRYRKGAFSPFNLGYLDHIGFPNRIRDFVYWILG